MAAKTVAQSFFSRPIQMANIRTEAEEGRRCDATTTGGTGTSSRVDLSRWHFDRKGRISITAQALRHNGNADPPQTSLVRWVTTNAASRLTNDDGCPRGDIRGIVKTDKPVSNAGSNAQNARPKTSRHTNVAHN